MSALKRSAATGVRDTVTCVRQQPLGGEGATHRTGVVFTHHLEELVEHGETLRLGTLVPEVGHHGQSHALDWTHEGAHETGQHPTPQRGNARRMYLNTRIHSSAVEMVIW